MKKNVLFSALAVVAAVSVHAAEVAGNNVAVVIRRDNIASASGHQLMCVPVKPFDITGQGQGTITLDDILPPALYEGCSVTLNSGTQGAVTYTAGNGAWTQALTQDASSVASPTLKTGEVLWLYNTNDKATVEGAGGEPVVFCGESNSANAKIVANGQLQAIGNATSAECSLADLFGTTFQEGDQISRIAKRGDANYTMYQYIYGSWYELGSTGGITSVNLADVKIAPGEAMYYYLKSTTTEAE